METKYNNLLSDSYMQRKLPSADAECKSRIRVIAEINTIQIRENGCKCLGVEFIRVDNSIDSFAKQESIKGEVGDHGEGGPSTISVLPLQHSYEIEKKIQLDPEPRRILEY